MLNRGLDKLELLRIVEAVANEKSIDKELVIESMESAIQKAALTKFGNDNSIEVSIDRESGEIKIQKVLEIVESPEDPNREIALDEAKSISEKKDLKIGDKIFEELPQIDFGRIAAQSAKQVISSRVREAEKNRQFEDFKDKQGFFDFNLTDKSMPFNSRFTEAIATLDNLRHQDPTSEMADDATMLVADSYFQREQYEKAHITLDDLVKVFPESEHQFIANYMMVQCKFLLYRGPDYSGVYLDEGEKQIRDIRRQFPVDSRQYAEQLDNFSRQFRYMQAERQWWVAQFYEGKEEFGGSDSRDVLSLIPALNQLQDLAWSSAMKLSWLRTQLQVLVGTR